ncbi:MAG: chorismate synthase [Parcubacteria group bacterium]|nr:chorismate synthase [Parcubacteria group bacterium]
MPGNTFGQLFQVTTAGESHGGALTAIIDGCPPGLELMAKDIQVELDRRRPGQSDITSQRQEEDKIEIMSGVMEGKTTGTPILLIARNKDARAEDYDHLKNLYRPGHADATYQAKYGIREWRGGGRASARETLARVAAGVVAQKYLREKFGVEIISYVEQIGDIKADLDYRKVTKKEVESNTVRCPDKQAAKEMVKLIKEVQAEGDSLGGIIRGVLRKIPTGLGEPVFDKLPADLAKAMMSIGATKGFEFGSGFAAAEMRGSKHNDVFCASDTLPAGRQGCKIKTCTNHAGGTLGGISTGEDIHFRVAFKPVATISKEQETVDKEGKKVKLAATGRHDPCVLPRAVPIVDGMAALVLMDHYLRHKAQNL